MIIPDVPYEEKAEFAEVCKNHNLDFISMIAPTSKDRIQMIAKEAEGFIYCVSSMGVTGVRSDFSNNLDEMIKSVREVTDVPVAIGFGISTPEQAATMAALSDGAIVGSAIVRIIAEHGTNAPAAVKEYVTNGYILIDQHEKKIFKSDVDLLYEYWGILEENACQ